MEEKKTNPVELLRTLLQMQADAITEKPISFPISLDDDSMVPKGKKVDKITIKPIKTRTVSQLTPLLLQLDKEELNKITANKDKDFNPESVEVFQKYHDLIMQIICIGIHNSKGSPPEWFRELLEANFTWNDLHIFLNAILFRMGNQSFHNSIILTSRMSPMDDRGMIALQKNLTSHSISMPS